MRIYYINNDKCLDVNKEMARMGNGMVRVAPIIGGTIAVAQMGAKFVAINAYTFGMIKFAEEFGVLPVGVTDNGLNRMYGWLFNLVK